MKKHIYIYIMYVDTHIYVLRLTQIFPTPKRNMIWNMSECI